MVKAAFIIVGFASGALLLGACSPFGGASAFHCTSDTQCSPGTCYTDGLCVVTDPGCTSGLKYQENSGSKSNTCVGGDTPMIDAPLDAPEMCTPNSTACFNHAIETCKADGTGFDPAQRVPCALTCQGTTPACVAASNAAANDQAMCNANNMAPMLAPTAGTVTINAADITCSMGCGGGVNTIARTSMSANAGNFYCLASISIPAGVTVTYGANVMGGVTLFSSGTVSVLGTIALNGGNATGVLNNTTNDDVRGAGGPGGFAGAPASGDDNSGTNGGGSNNCGGRGGPTGGAAGDRAGAGGGGGGNQSNGGTGGDGRRAGGTTVTGGVAGSSTGCSTAELRPLVGGAGGGAGGDGACTPGFPCGWPGGGGGGGLHIASRSTITIGNTISANGGNGFGETTQPGGGGGGGAGGGILLEAPMVTIMGAGALTVDGGTGGASKAAATGGAGATAGTATGGDGGDANANDQGGAGAGGASGRIRINANNAACTAASPTAACTTGALRATP